MDGTEEREDTSQAGDSSGKEQGTSETPGTFTKESQEKAVSDALAKAGREAKSLDGQSKQLKTDRDQLAADRAQWQKDKDDAELEAVKDDPDAMTAAQAKQKHRAKETELTEREKRLDQSEKTHKADLEQIAVLNRTKVAAEVAVAKGVSMDAILKLAKDDTREAMEAVAEHLPKTTETTDLKVDSSKTAGGGEQTEQARLAARYPTMAKKS